MALALALIPAPALSLRPWLSLTLTLTLTLTTLTLTLTLIGGSGTDDVAAQDLQTPLGWYVWPSMYRVTAGIVVLIGCVYD